MYFIFPVLSVLYVSSTVGAVSEAFCFLATRSCVRDYTLKFCKHDIYKPLAGISPSLQLRCRWGRSWAGYTLRSKVKGRCHSETAYHQISTIGGIFTCRLNAWTNLSHLLTRFTRHDDIFKVMALNVKVIYNIFRLCTFLAEAHRSTVRHRSPYNLCRSSVFGTRHTCIFHIQRATTCNGSGLVFVTTESKRSSSSFRRITQIMPLLND